MTTPSTNERGRLCRAVLWAVPWVVFVFAALDLASRPWTAGHDSNVHTLNAIALHHVLREAPAQAGLLLNRLFVHWPPLTYFTAALALAATPSVWAFHAVTLFYAALFLLFLYLCAARLTADPWLRLLTMLAPLANPEWPNLFTSFSLEPAHLAALVMLTWAALSDAAERSPAASAALGLGCGLLFLAKLQLFAYFCFLFPAMFAVMAVRRWPERRARAGVLLFFGAMTVPVLLWYAPQAARTIRIVLVEDAYSFGSVHTAPWTFYPWVLLGQFAGAPLFLTVLWAARRIEQKPARRALVPLVGAGSALALLSLVGVKRPLYVYGVYVLLVMFLIAVLDRLPARRRARVAGALVGYYALLALLVWAPTAEPVWPWLSLGTPTARGIAAMDGGSGDSRDRASGSGRGDGSATPAVEARLANGLAPLLSSVRVYSVATLDFQTEVRSDRLAELVAMRQPAFALIGGLWATDLARLDDLALSRLDSACFLAAFEKPGARGPSWNALQIAERIRPQIRHADELRGRLAAAADQWREVFRAPTGSSEFALYRNDRQCLDDSNRMPPALTIPANLLLNAGNRPEEAERLAAALFAAPRPDAPADEVSVLAQHIVRGVPPSSPAQLATARRLIPRLLELARRGLDDGGRLTLLETLLRQGPPAAATARAALQAIVADQPSPPERPTETSTEAIADWLARAVIARQTASAVLLARLLADRRPNDPEAWLALGEALRAAERWDEEAAVLQETAARFVGSPQLAARVDRRRRDLAAAGAAPDRADALVRHAAFGLPEAPADLMALGERTAWRAMMRRLIDDGRSAEAAAALRATAAGLDPSPSLAALAREYAAGGLPAREAVAREAALAFDATDGDAFAGLVDCLPALGVETARAALDGAARRTGHERLFADREFVALHRLAGIDRADYWAVWLRRLLARLPPEHPWTCAAFARWSTALDGAPAAASAAGLCSSFAGCGNELKRAGRDAEFLDVSLSSLREEAGPPEHKRELWRRIASWAMENDEVDALPAIAAAAPADPVADDLLPAIAEKLQRAGSGASAWADRERLATAVARSPAVR